MEHYSPTDGHPKPIPPLMFNGEIKTRDEEHEIDEEKFDRLFFIFFCSVIVAFSLIGTFVGLMFLTPPYWFIGLFRKNRRKE